MFTLQFKLGSIQVFKTTLRTNFRGAQIFDKIISDPYLYDYEFAVNKLKETYNENKHLLKKSSQRQLEKIFMEV